MHITQESDYAVRIVYCLAKSGGRMDARALGEEMVVPLRFALKILGKLAAAGLVNSFKGNGGGYELARPAQQVTLQDVIAAVEGPYRFSRCLVAPGQQGQCTRDACGLCSFQQVFARITGLVNQELAATNFAAVLAQEQMQNKK